MRSRALDYGDEWMDGWMEGSRCHVEEYVWVMMGPGL